MSQPHSGPTVPTVLAEDEMEMEFQVAPMVDVLLVLLLFFMATATTEVTMQRANLTLPKALDAKEIEGKDALMDINIEKLDGSIEVKGLEQKITDPENLVPLVKSQLGQYTQSPGYDPNKPFRVFIRADVNTQYQRIHEVMKACAKAGVPDVSFAINEDKEGKRARGFETK
ncbi:MAG: biopolymer transporter ExbD [Candidatus Methylacidiphilales bacterium]|nr:biopolymer transporter ExbD [Candidatus Methylacidiphilales bacterium]